MSIQSVFDNIVASFYCSKSFDGDYYIMTSMGLYSEREEVQGFTGENGAFPPDYAPEPTATPAPSEEPAA